jgi:hypothetical protein
MSKIKYKEFNGLINEILGNKSIGLFQSIYGIVS